MLTKTQLSILLLIGIILIVVFLHGCAGGILVKQEYADGKWQNKGRIVVTSFLGSLKVDGDKVDLKSIAEIPDSLFSVAIAGAE